MDFFEDFFFLNDLPLDSFLFDFLGWNLESIFDRENHLLSSIAQEKDKKEDPKRSRAT